MLTSLLFILLYALVALLICYLIFYVVELFLPIPANVKKIVLAIVGVLIVIQIVQLLTGGQTLFYIPPHLLPRP